MMTMMMMTACACHARVPRLSNGCPLIPEVPLPFTSPVGPSLASTTIDSAIVRATFTVRVAQRGSVRSKLDIHTKSLGPDANIFVSFAMTTPGRRQVTDANAKDQSGALEKPQCYDSLDNTARPFQTKCTSSRPHYPLPPLQAALLESARASGA